MPNDHIITIYIYIYERETKLIRCTHANNNNTVVTFFSNNNIPNKTHHRQHHIIPAIHDDGLCTTIRTTKRQKRIATKCSRYVQQCVVCLTQKCCAALAALTAEPDMAFINLHNTTTTTTTTRCTLWNGYGRK